MTYNLKDLGTYNYEWNPGYISRIDKIKIEDEANKVNRELKISVGNYMKYRDKFTYATKNLFQPITSEISKSGTESTNKIIDSTNKVVDTLKSTQDQINNNILTNNMLTNEDLNNGSSTNLPVTPELQKLNENKDIFDKYMNNESDLRDCVFGLVEFDDELIRFGALDEIDNHDFMKSKHHFEFQFDTAKIIVKRKDEISRDWPFTENLIRYLTLDIDDIQDENAKAQYLEIITYAIGPELTKIKTAGGKSTSRKQIISNFRKNKKFRNIISKTFGIKSLGYSDAEYDGDGLGKTLPIVVPPEMSENWKQVLVVLGKRKALGDDIGENKNHGFDEFTELLTKMLNNKEIDKTIYKKLLYRWEEVD